MKIFASIILGFSLIASIIHASSVTAEHKSKQVLEAEAAKRLVNVSINHGRVDVSADVSNLDREEFQDLIYFLKDTTNTDYEQSN